MDYSSDYGTPLYSFHPYKKNSSNQTNRITGRGSKVLHTQQTKEERDMINLLFGKKFNRGVGDGCVGWVIAHPAFVRIQRGGGMAPLINT